MKKLLALAFAASLAALVAAPALAAGVTNLWTTQNGGVNFPITPNSIDAMTIGGGTPAPGTFTTLTANQVIPAAGLPTIASGACGATTNGAIVAGSTNQSGSFTIGAAATTTCTVAFSATLSVAPKACTFSAMNAAAAAVTVLPFMSAPTTGGFVFNGAVLANTNWAYHCI